MSWPGATLTDTAELTEVYEPASALVQGETIVDVDVA